MLEHALKEWAVICAALAQGRQALLLRKGGVAEERGEFVLEQQRFWLMPTYVHQQEQGVRAEAQSLLEQVRAEQPPAGTLRLSHFAEVTGVYHVHDLLPALMLAHLHYWTDDTVEKRFNYRSPGLYVLPLRVYRAAQVHEIPDSPAYVGCKSWVHLDRFLPTAGSTPVLGDKDYEDIKVSLDLLLQPRAYA